MIHMLVILIQKGLLAAAISPKTRIQKLNMWKAIDLASNMVKDGGALFISIYNDQGGASKMWLMIKQVYNKLPLLIQPVFVLMVASYFEVKYALIRLIRGKNPFPFSTWREKKKNRGMSVWYDWVDWCGGLPFEVAKPEQVILPLIKKDFDLTNLITCGGGSGCNQYVFKRTI